MKPSAVLVLAACLVNPIFSYAGDTPPAQALTAAEIVEKNVAARGGLEAWQKIQTMVWVGHIESAHAPAPNMEFALEMKRPNMTRFEIKVQNQKSVRIFDGSHGWKLRPTSSGKPDLQQYTTEELNYARNGPGIDGPLMDYQAKGTDVTLDGVDDIEGHQTYRLNIKLSSGVSHHVWIDAQTFLDVKYDREAINTSGQSVMVPVFYRNYQAIEGLQVPLMIETGTGTAHVTDKMAIDKVLINPQLDNQIFAKPDVPQRRNVVTVNATATPSSRELK